MRTFKSRVESKLSPKNPAAATRLLALTVSPFNPSEQCVPLEMNIFWTDIKLSAIYFCLFFSKQITCAAQGTEFRACVHYIRYQAGETLVQAGP